MKSFKIFWNKLSLIIKVIIVLFACLFLFLPLLYYIALVVLGKPKVSFKATFKGYWSALFDNLRSMFKIGNGQDDSHAKFGVSDPLYKKYNDAIGNKGGQPRGQRNNNPLNIKHGNDWKGETDKPMDELFESFEHVKYGIRAATKVLRTYRKKHGLKTLRQIITRWSTTDQESYILYVSRKLGISPEVEYDVRSDDKVVKLIKVMHVFENGKDYLTEAQIREGVELA